MIWTEAHYDLNSRRWFWAVVIEGRQIEAFWTRAEALQFARKQAADNFLTLRTAQILPFERRASA